MGQTQTLPLPRRIPVPKPKQLSQLEEMGVTIGDELEGYVFYTMPEGWKMKDISTSQDFPEFVMVDLNDDIRVSVFGSWKGTYDNKLRMRVEDAPYNKYEPPQKSTIEKSETSIEAKAFEFAQAIYGNDIDPEPIMPRQPDYR